MSLRSLPERAIQTIAFELDGTLIATPLYARDFSAPVEGSLALIAALSAAVMLWSPLHDTLFDRLTCASPAAYGAAPDVDGRAIPAGGAGGGPGV